MAFVYSKDWYLIQLEFAGWKTNYSSNIFETWKLETDWPELAYETDFLKWVCFWEYVADFDKPFDPCFWPKKTIAC